VPSRLAAEYPAAVAAELGSEISEHNAEVIIRKRAPEHDDASVDRRGSEVLGIRFAWSRPKPVFDGFIVDAGGGRSKNPKPYQECCEAMNHPEGRCNRHVGPGPIY